LWRLMSDPLRLGRRYFDCLAVLPLLLLNSLLTKPSTLQPSN
jgi:UDP-N-acetyl-D-mannosaminuronic acid transferase (WecB/TagA/CpsF family)